ncbi:PTS transporter subunit EIIC, partial [Staphylococcus aureus]
MFHNMGGSGTTFSLAIMLLFLSKSKQLKEIGKLAIGPAFFNINEPILFGLPIVMSPILIIPFRMAPLVTVMVTYLAMYSGLLAKVTGVALPWTTPPFISGFLATSHWTGAAIQVVN